MSTVERVTWIFSTFICRSLTFQQSSMSVTVLKPSVYKVPVRYCFQWRKTTVCYREQLGKEGTQLLSFKTVKWNQSFFLRKLTKMSNLILCFSEIPSIFYLCPHKAGGLFIWGLKKVVCLKQCPLYGFCFRDAWKGTIQETDRIKRVFSKSFSARSLL